MKDKKSKNVNLNGKSAKIANSIGVDRDISKSVFINGIPASSDTQSKNIIIGK